MLKVSNGRTGQVTGNIKIDIHIYCTCINMYLILHNFHFMWFGQCNYFGLRHDLWLYHGYIWFTKILCV